MGRLLAPRSAGSRHVGVRVCSRAVAPPLLLEPEGIAPGVLVVVPDSPLQACPAVGRVLGDHHARGAVRVEGSLAPRARPVRLRHLPVAVGAIVDVREGRSRPALDGHSRPAVVPDVPVVRDRHRASGFDSSGYYIQSRRIVKLRHVLHRIRRHREAVIKRLHDG